MTTSNKEDERSEQLAATGTEPVAGPADRPSSAAIARTLTVAIFMAVAGAWIAFGCAAWLLRKVTVKLASGELRIVRADCMASIGAVSNPDNMNQKIGKAGRTRWLGKRPHNRGVVMNPVDHPLGGGEGRSSGGRHPVSPWGQPAKGYKTRSNKRTDGMIIRRRNKGK